MDVFISSYAIPSYDHSRSLSAYTFYVFDYANAYLFDMFVYVA